MAAPFAHDDLEKLKKFIDFVSSNPPILNMPQLEFVKKFIEKFGGTVPAGEFEMPAGGGKCPFGGDAQPESKPAPTPAPEQDEGPEQMDEDDEDSEESELELDEEGVIEPDTDVNQPMGDSSKIPSEEDVDKSSELRSEAAAAYSEQKFQAAIDLYTKAIEINPGNALFHAKRGQAFLKLKKPNACIRDCYKALEINCDSAAAYKFRGRANRLLGNWEEAAKDLRQACKLDYDEETDEWLREVTPNAKKIEQHRLKQQRKKAEHERKANEKKRQKARAQAQQQQQQKKPASGGGPSSDGFPGGAGGGGFPGGFPGGLGGLSGANLTGLLAGMKDPEFMAAMQDIIVNPANVEKYKSNPKIAKYFESMMKDFPAGGGAGGMPDARHFFPGAEAADAAGAAASEPTAPKEEEKPKDAPKKPDFVDDGLD